MNLIFFIITGILILVAFLYGLFDHLDFRRSVKNFNGTLASHLSQYNKLESLGLSNNLKIHFKWRSDKKRAFHAMLREYDYAKKCRVSLFFSSKSRSELEQMERSIIFYFPNLSKHLFDI